MSTVVIFSTAAMLQEKDDPADEGLRQKIRAIIEKSDVSTISMKKVRVCFVLPFF